MHWREMMSRDIRKFNAFQQGRYDWIIKTAGELKGEKILDLGCGDGALTYLLAKRGALVIGIDNEELGLEFARENMKSVDPRGKLKCEFVLASAYALPFPEKSFDIVANCEVIEHLEEPERMLAEVKKVLKPGGKLILTTPYRLTEIPGDPNHVREYFPSEIEAMLRKYFAVVEIKLTHHIFWYAIFTYSFRHFGNRQFGKWLVNALTLWFKFNPFLLDYLPGKRVLFTQILASASN